MPTELTKELLLAAHNRAERITDGLDTQGCVRLAESFRQDWRMLIDALTAAEQRTEAAEKALADRWQPIESAPKGKAVIVFKANTKEIFVAAYISGACGPGWCTQDGFELFKVSHWQPLPDPPVMKGPAE